MTGLLVLIALVISLGERNKSRSLRVVLFLALLAAINQADQVAR